MRVNYFNDNQALNNFKPLILAAVVFFSICNRADAQVVVSASTSTPPGLVAGQSYTISSGVTLSGAVSLGVIASSITNNGVWSPGSTYALSTISSAGGVTGAITNNGNMFDTGSANLVTIYNANIGSIVNNGTTQSNYTQIALGSLNLGSFTNNGSMSIVSPTTSGASLLRFVQDTYGGQNTFGSITNSSSGTILATNGYAIRSTAASASTSLAINSINNAGTITAGLGGFQFNGNTNVSSITNTGTINAPIGIAALTGASIGSLNNSQGVGNTNGALTYQGTLPTNYNIIVNSASYYGQLSGSSLAGSTTVGISGGISALTAYGGNVYTGLLQGLSSSNIANYSSLNIGNWTAINSSFYSKWYMDSSGLDLVVAQVVNTGNVSTAGLATGVTYPKFDGGTLVVSSSGTYSNAFTVTSNNGKIDQNGNTAIFAGNISNDSVGVGGKLTIINSGTAGSGLVTLSGANTYSGGTEVDVGANLSISSANNLGTGTLALVGSSTVPAVLTTTANMTISNPITVSGDPTFNVSSGTTTTVSSTIADGTSPGDVVVTGGGTLALSAANTYTGRTTINSGSTLALTGSGSIANSSGVTNTGTFDITGKTGNVSILSYTQGSSGVLAMNYAPGSTQQLNVAGAAALAGTLSLIAGSGSYTSGKYTLLTAGSGISGSFSSLSLSSYTSLNYFLSYDSNDVYLILAPNTGDTQQSLTNSAVALRNTFTLQNSVLANSFSYDCNQFGENGICISAGGRNTAVSAANGLNNNSALLIAAYRPYPNYRIGAYADQNFSMNNAGSTVNLGNNTPLIGLFGAWNERVDGTGAEIKVSAAYGQKNTTVTRQVVGTSEPGSGGANLTSQGAQMTAKYSFAVTKDSIVAPYVGVRYTQNNMGGYTEGTSSLVTAPLTYSSLNTNATTVLAGLGASYQLTPAAVMFASAGVESDTNTANGSYLATSPYIPGLTPINFNASPVKTRPTAMLGAYYDVEKNQRLGITAIYRQEPFQAVQTTSVMATYTVGM